MYIHCIWCMCNETKCQCLKQNKYTADSDICSKCHNVNTLYCNTQKNLLVCQWPQYSVVLTSIEAALNWCTCSRALINYRCMQVFLLSIWLLILDWVNFFCHSKSHHTMPINHSQMPQLKTAMTVRKCE